MQKHILFVDDEAHILQGLQRMLRPMRREWSMDFVTSGREALERLAQTSYDVIVSDMRMPEMDGAQLLREVKQHYPHIVRILLSGHSDQEMLLRSIGVTHQFLAKPCEATKLKSTIVRAGTMQNLLADETLKQLVAGLHTLPSLPNLYLEVIEAAQAPGGSLEKIGKIVARDVSMTAKILQLVNSAFFGLPRHVGTAVEAVNLLGFDTVKALVLSVQIFENSDPTKLQAFPLESLWQHSMAVGSCAKAIARAENGHKQMIDESFMAGLLHDVGKLVLALNLPQPYSQVLSLVEDGMIECDAERATFGVTHGEVGAYLLGLWGLPTAIVEALTFHHFPSACLDRTFSPLTAVHVANALVREEGTADQAGTAALIDAAYLAELDLEERLAHWREDYHSTRAAGSRA